MSIIAFTRFSVLIFINRRHRILYKNEKIIVNINSFINDFHLQFFSIFIF